MSSLFNKEDEDKLLPPEPCADQYVCLCIGGVGDVLGWAWGLPSPMSFLSGLSYHRGLGRASHWLFLFLSAGERVNQHIWEFKLDL